MDNQPTTKKPWYKRTWVIIVAVLIIGIGIGGASAETPDPTESTDYTTLSDKLDATQAELDATQAELDEANADLETIAGELPEREDQLEADIETLAEEQDSLKTAQGKLKKAQAAVAKREKAVGITEKTVAANTINGEGVYRVGTDMQAGTYRSVDNVDCYWMLSSDANGSNILQNNIVTGPALVTVSPGQFFNSTRCGDWVLQP